MNANDLLSELRERGVTVSATNEALTVRAPAGITISDELRNGLVTHKVELLRILRNEQRTATPATPAVQSRKVKTSSFPVDQEVLKKHWRLTRGSSKVRVYELAKDLNLDTRRLIEEVRRMGVDVTVPQLDKSLKFLKAPTIKHPETLPSIRAYYRPALHLALLLIRHHGISFINRKGKIVLPSLLINLKRAFENYLRNTLQLKLRDFESGVRVLDGNLKGADGGGKPLFDESSWPNATPDIVFKRTDSDTNLPEFPVIADTKYKDFITPTRSDIEQAITYAASYRAPNVVIIHPRVEQSVHGLHLLGRIEPFAVYHYAFDLAAKNPNLEEQKFADSFGSFPFERLNVCEALLL